MDLLGFSNNVADRIATASGVIVVASGVIVVASEVVILLVICALVDISPKTYGWPQICGGLVIDMKFNCTVRKDLFEAKVFRREHAHCMPSNTGLRYTIVWKRR